MKRRLNELPIKTKLIIISVLTCLVTLVLAGGVIAFYDNYLYQQRKTGEFSAQAEIVASSMTASLEFQDAQAAQEYLRPLNSNPQIMVGAVYNEDGSLFASYSRDSAHAPPQVAQPVGEIVGDGAIAISRPVMQNNLQIGSVYLLASIESISVRLTRYTGTFLLAMIISLLITLPIAMRLHYAIANPVYARSLIEASLDPLVTINTGGKIMDVNHAATQATGLSRKDLIGTDFSRYFTDPELAEAGYQQAFKDGHVTDYPLTICHADGRLIDVLYNASVYKDERGNPLGIVAAARDVTAQKQTEREIQRRTAELQAANQELEAFSYSVSHDLRAPLRAIDGFSLALVEDYADKLDDTARNYLDRVRAATQRMGHLIDDMLALSRITRVEMRHQTINLSDMATEVLMELQKTDPERKVEWKVQPGLKAEGDASLMRIVLDNLLGNAWKYTGRQAQPHIEFAAVTGSDGTREYFVRDNGAGFDMAYAGKLFGAFQRLHSAADFSGTGVGLATVQRVIHRHGGKVRGEGKPDEGATFYFSLSQ